MSVKIFSVGLQSADGSCGLGTALVEAKDEEDAKEVYALFEGKTAKTITTDVLNTWIVKEVTHHDK